VKIIQAPEEFKPMHLDCGHCRAQLLAESPADFERESYSDFRESWDYARARCPCCGMGIQVPKERFPHHVYEKLRRAK
jgi:hypothetical protein